MDLTLKGRRIDILFSMCRIKQFTETTDSMQDEIIVFVNKIVKIIHESTKRWDGYPTKNYGEKFLLTWRLPRAEDAIDLIKAE
jgi:class 3 adenylate cyclase